MPVHPLHPRPRSLLACGVAVLVAALALPAAAGASTASRSGATITITGGAETNQISLPDGYLLHIEDLAGITAAGDCTQVTPTKANCGPTGNGITVVVNLGDGNDTFSWTVGETFGSLNLDGGPGDDTIVGTSNPDTINGGEGNDTIDAIAGNDTVDGGPGNDKLKGAGGDDTVTGGPGRDSLSGDGEAFAIGNDGNDTIEARDGEGDQVTCGLGADAVRGDVVDTVDDSCEQVDRGGTSGTPPPPGGNGLTVGISAASSARLATLLRGKGFAFRISFTGACHGAFGLVLRRTEARRLKLGRTEVVLDGEEGDIPGAGVLSVRTKPAKRYLKRLRGQRRVTAVIAVVCTDASGATATARRTVVFRR